MTRRPVPKRLPKSANFENFMQLPVNKLKNAPERTSGGNKTASCSSAGSRPAPRKGSFRQTLSRPTALSFSTPPFCSVPRASIKAKHLCDWWATRSTGSSIGLPPTATSLPVNKSPKRTSCDGISRISSLAGNY